jgi:hypothetical protein
MLEYGTDQFREYFLLKKNYLLESVHQNTEVYFKR